MDFLKLKIDKPSPIIDEQKKSMNIYSQAVAAREATKANDTKKMQKNLEVNMNSHQVTPSPISCPMPSANQPRGINNGLDSCPLTE